MEYNVIFLLYRGCPYECKNMSSSQHFTREQRVSLGLKTTVIQNITFETKGGKIPTEDLGGGRKKRAFIVKSPER